MKALQQVQALSVLEDYTCSVMMSTNWTFSS